MWRTPGSPSNSREKRVLEFLGCVREHAANRLHSLALLHFAGRPVRGIVFERAGFHCSLLFFNQPLQFWVVLSRSRFEFLCKPNRFRLRDLSLLSPSLKFVLVCSPRGQLEDSGCGTGAGRVLTLQEGSKLAAPLSLCPTAFITSSCAGSDWHVLVNCANRV